MIRDKERRRRRERGQNLVEMALVLPLLALLLMGVIDMGRAFHSYIIVTNAAREGARRASRYPDQTTTIKNAVLQEAANSGVDLVDGDNTTITVEGLGGSLGDPIRVTVVYTYPTIIGGLIGLPEFPMSSSTEMVVFGYTN